MGENIVTSDLSSFIKFEGGGEREKKKKITKTAQ